MINIKFFLLAFLMLIQFSITDLWTTTYIISGAGAPAVNGRYDEIGSWNGRPLYAKGNPASWYLFYSYPGNIGKWKIYTTYADPDISYYYNDSHNATPPQNGWISTSYGTDPPPIVTLEEVLPVELAYFEGCLDGNKIILKWKTYSESQNYRFEILKKCSEFDDFMNIGFVYGNGTTTSPHDYSFEDFDINKGIQYYLLKQVDLDGSCTFSDVIAIEINDILTYKLNQNYPNPFNLSTIITFKLPEQSDLKLLVYDIMGREIQTIMDGEYKAGNYKVLFNADRLLSGLYFIKLKTNNFVDIKKMTILK